MICCLQVAIKVYLIILILAQEVEKQNDEKDISTIDENDGFFGGPHSHCYFCYATKRCNKR